ncbi:vomeronasal type-2 receptor 26-like [Anomaloglossus baeobatrachus]|uniref:vomeronasal type-2 receptor 26-like n=1 Tax=Anomaloglossus baeobatrachus TaxID=238106 RepID=UPI003F4F64CE
MPAIATRYISLNLDIELIAKKQATVAARIKDQKRAAGLSTIRSIPENGDIIESASLRDNLGAPVPPYPKVIMTQSKVFTEYGDLLDEYEIHNHIIVNQTLHSSIVGHISPIILDHLNMPTFYINDSLIQWKTINNEKPKSQCTKSCLPGSRKVSGNSMYFCCYGCIPCSEGEISNSSDNENCRRCPDYEWSNEKKTQCVPKVVDFLSYSDKGLSLIALSGSILLFTVTAVILRIFIRCQDTPIVRANNKNLSFVLLVSIMLSFLCVFLFLGRPVDITCMIRQICTGLLLSISISSLLAKTITVYIAFKATKPGSVWRTWTGVKLPNCVLLICSSVQVVICMSWVTLCPPFQELDTQSYTEKIIVQCNEGSDLWFYSVLGYMGILAAVSFITAFLARTLPDSFNEAKYITFSMLVFCSVWIAMIPAYLSTKGKYTVAVEIFAILTSNAGLLGCIFFPKCYIILYKPERNTKSYIMRRIV